MNVFRVMGDMSHLFSFVMLLTKINATRSVAGISLKTQELYVIVFVARYLDLFWNFLSIYNWIMKVLFISLSISIVYIMRNGTPQASTYDKERDSFPYIYLIVPCVLLGMAINQDHTSLFEMLWAFSIYLEAVAIMPQLHMIQKCGETDNMTGHYVFLLGMYRAFYLLNWIYRYFTEPDYYQLIVWISGLIQTALYCDFFYNYYQSKKAGLKGVKVMELPV